jgi:hypothetical protein
MRIDREMRKAVQNSLLWERFRAEPIIEAEGGICEVVAGNVSRAISPPWSMAASRHLAGRGVKAREGSVKASIGLSA